MIAIVLIFFGLAFAEHVPDRVDIPPPQAKDDDVLDPEKLTIEKLLKALNRTNPSSKAEFLKALPPECRSRHLLVYNSRATICASYEEPRILINCSLDHGRFQIAIDGEPEKGKKHSECQKAEILESDPKTGKVSSIEFTFQEKKGFAPNRDPVRCYSCHGQPLRHLADFYPYWPGFYVSEQKNMVIDSPEGKGYAAYKTHREKHLLYSQLIPHEEAKGNEGARTISLRLKENDAPMHTSYFSTLDKMHSKRIDFQVAAHPNFQQARFALAASIIGCDNIETFFPKSWKERRAKLEEIQTLVNRGATRGVRRVVDEVYKTNPTNITKDVREKKYPVDEIWGSDKTTPDKFVKMTYVLSQMGLPLSTLTSSVDALEVNFPIGPRFALENSFSPDRLSDEFGYESVSDSVTEVRRLLRGFAWKSDEGKKKGCEKLKEMSRNEFKKLPLARRGPPSPPKLGKPAKVADVLKKCAPCHTPPLSEKLAAGALPFSSEAAFRRGLNDDASLGESIKKRIQSASFNKMPPNEELSVEEVRELQKFIDGTE